MPEPIIEARHLVRVFGGGRTWYGAGKPELRAVDDVTLGVQPGTTLGIVGESGCGKSTLARMLTGLLVPTSGTIRLEGRPITRLDRAAKRRFHQTVQLVFQDPIASLNPRKTVRQILEGPLEALTDLDRSARRARVAALMDEVGLRPEFIDRYPHEFSGGQRQRVGIGTEFAELREYAIGDDPRFIDWKATARRSAPLIRVLEPEREQSLIVLLDRGRLMTANVKGLSRFDWGLNATLSLALAGLHRGDRVGVGVFDREMHTWIPATGGRPHLQRLIEKLTPIQPALLESDYLGAVTQVATQQHRRALVVVITDIVDQTASAELLTALTRLKSRHLPFCVTLRDPQVDAQAHAFADDVIDAYSRAVALDLLDQRQVAFMQLKQAGVLVLDAPADQITDPLVEDYLRIKARNRL